ncbi:MAG: hypothetical protein ABJ201_18085, partial [Nisaea sp.]
TKKNIRAFCLILSVASLLWSTVFKLRETIAHPLKISETVSDPENFEKLHTLLSIFLLRLPPQYHGEIAFSHRHNVPKDL